MEPVWWWVVCDLADGTVLQPLDTRYSHEITSMLTPGTMCSTEKGLSFLFSFFFFFFNKSHCACPYEAKNSWESCYTVSANGTNLLAGGVFQFTEHRWGSSLVQRDVSSHSLPLPLPTTSVLPLTHQHAMQAVYIKLSKGTRDGRS